jgi:hypothetical protein
MRTGVEAGRFQLTSHVSKRATRVVAYGKTAPDQPIDVEHPEPDSLHMKCADCEPQRRAFLEECVTGRALRLCLHISDQQLQVFVGSFAVIDSRHIVASAVRRKDHKW